MKFKPGDIILRRNGETTQYSGSMILGHDDTRYEFKMRNGEIGSATDWWLEANFMVDEKTLVKKIMNKYGDS